MWPRIFARSLLLIFALLAGCGRDDPQAALEAAVQQLQEQLEAKQNRAVLAQLHPQFAAQRQYDRDWAKRSMTLLFLRHQNVRVIALSKDSRIDPSYPEKGHTDARVALTGGAGLIPEQAAHYRVQLEWWRDDGEWKLARLNWE